MQCSAVQCSAVQCSAVQCSAVQCSGVNVVLRNAAAQQQTGQYIRQRLHMPAQAKSTLVGSDFPFSLKVHLEKLCMQQSLAQTLWTGLHLYAMHPACNISHQASLCLACIHQHLYSHNLPMFLPSRQHLKPQQHPRIPAGSPPSPLQHTQTVSDHVQEGMKASPEAVAERGKYGWNWNPFAVSEAA